MSRGLEESLRPKDEDVIQVSTPDELSNDFESLCLSETCADVHFLVEGEWIPGHKAILCCRSQYFQVMLLRNMSESSKNEILLPLLSSTFFKTQLRFIYSGNLPFSSDDSFDLLETANQFGEIDIDEAILSYLEKNLTCKNIVESFNVICCYTIKPLQVQCLDYVRENTRSIHVCQTFKSFSKAAMDMILKEPVYVPDNILYSAILEWSESQDNYSDEIISTYLKYHCLNSENKGIFLDLGAEKEVNYFEMEFIAKAKAKTFSYSIEFSLDRTNWTRIMDSNEYPMNVKSLCFPTQKIRYINIKEDDGQLMIHSFNLYFYPKIPILETTLIYPPNNVAIAEMGALSPNVELLKGKTTSHDCRHEEFLSIRLGQPYLIDSFRFLLWDRARRYYHYYIDCSLDNNHWTRIIDRKKFRSRSWQNFVFDPTPMMYIKIVGTYNSENRWFHCTHFECPSQDKGNAVRL